MQRVSKSLTLVVSALMLVSVGFTQQASVTAVPNLIRYGGTLKDAQGAPLSSSTVGITFAIYTQQDGGAPIWMETQNVATDASGNYNALLGSATVNGLPGDLFSRQEQRWLGVQVQGEAEQPRVLLVSVPYAFKAHEAETLGGKSISDFVLARDANPAENGSTEAQAGSSTANNSRSTQPETGTGASSQGPTNFSGTTTNQIVGVTQTGTGAGVNATAPNDAIVGTATGSYGYALYGIATGVGGVAVKGASTSPSGTGARGIETATSGATTGISSYVASSAGIAAVFNNAAGGKIISGQNNGVEKFSVDGSGNVNAVGTFSGSGSGLTGIGFSNLSGTLASSQFSGTYSSGVTLSNSANVFYGNGSHLAGVVAGAVFVNTNYPIVNLPTQAGQQVALGALLLPSGAFNMLNQSFDIWASITWVGLAGGIFQPGLYLCDTSTCSGQLNAELGYAPEAHGPNPEPSGINVRASYAMSAAGTSASAVGSEAVQVDTGDSSSPIYSSSNQQSQQFDSTQSLYFVVMIYMDSIGTQFGTPTAQMNALRLSVAY